METRDYQTLLVNVRGSIATLTMSIPERKNPLGPQMINELLWALDDAKDDEAIRCVVLTGAGGNFSAGGDLKQMSGKDGLAAKGDFVDLLLRFTTLGKPTVAVVEGYALGGGLGLIASCDLAVAADSAQFGLPEIKRGLFPMMIMAVLARTIPRRQLLEMMLLGERFSARQAQSWGLLGRVVDDEQLTSSLDEITKKLASQSPTAMRMGLHAFHRQADLTYAEALPSLRSDLFALLQTDDGKEGLTAFLEKREPKWVGR